MFDSARGTNAAYGNVAKEFESLDYSIEGLVATLSASKSNSR
jgi:hypothetical protein